MIGADLLARLLGRRRNADQVPVIMILAAARTGSNLLCERFAAVSGHLSLFEVFSPDAVYGLQSLPEGQPTLVPGLAPGELPLNDPRLLAAMQEDPVRAIAALARTAKTAGRKAMSYKVFPQQITPEKLMALVDARPAAFVVLGRSRIAAYASFKKARAAQSWTHTDLSDVPVTGALEELQVHWGARDRQYRRLWERACRLGLPRLVLDYDRDIDNGQVRGSVNRALALAGTDLTLPEDARPTKMRRQRRPLDAPFDAFENGADFRAEVEAAGMLDYALGSVVQELDG